MFFSFEEIKKIADVVRDIDLRILLQSHGCINDPRDKARWRTPCGIISVTGQKFTNWTIGVSGGGAIDLVIHLQCFEFIDAVLFLYYNFSPISVRQSPPKQTQSPKRNLILPQKDDRKLPQVIHYLTIQRCLPKWLIDNFIESGKLYADIRANAVFLLLGKKKKIVGAELRGTHNVQWRGMASGSQKKLGCFYIVGTSARKMIVCESAIDAASCSLFYPEYTAISTSGATANPGWLQNFIAKNCEIYCGFDSDRTGNMLANKMIDLYPSIKRLHPPRHDWNEALQQYHS